MRLRPASVPVACAALVCCGALACSRPTPGPRVLVHTLTHPENANGVLLNEEIDFGFSGEIDRASVTRESVRIQGRNGIPARGKLLVEGSKVRFLPAPVLARDLRDGGYLPDTAYDVEIAGFPRLDGLRGIHGEPLEKTYRYEFRTVSVDEPRAGLIFDDPDPASARPLAFFPAPAFGTYRIGLQDSIYLKSDKPIDPSTIAEDGFELRRLGGGEPPIPLRARLLENEAEPLPRPRNPSARSIAPDTPWEQPRAALLELTPLKRPRIGSYTLSLRPTAPRFGPSDFIGHKVWQPALSSLPIDVADRGPDAGHSSLSLDFFEPRYRSPIAVPDKDGTVCWTETGRAEVRFPLAAGNGASGSVCLGESPGATLDAHDLHAVRLDLEAGATCNLTSEPGLVVLRSQGRMRLSGSLARTIPAAAADNFEGFADVATRDDARHGSVPLTEWLRRLREQGRTCTVLIAGGDLVIESGGQLNVNTPLLLCAGGSIRIEGSVHGLAGLVFLLGDGGGLDIKPAASRADLLEIDQPQGANPLREMLHLAVLSSPIPPRGKAANWLPAEAQGSKRPETNRNGVEIPASTWNVRYVRELAPGTEHLSEFAAVDDPSNFEGGGSIQLLIELDVAPGGAWRPPFVDFVHLSWEPEQRGAH